MKDYKLTKLLSIFLPQPRFSVDKERAFDNYYLKQTIGITRFALFLGILLYAVFGLLDPYIVTNIKHKVWFIRYALICPIFTLALIFTYLSKQYRRVQLAGTFAITMAGLGIVMMMFLDTGTKSVSYYYGGLMLVIFYGYTFMRLRFVNSLVCGWSVTLFYLAMATIDKKMNFVLTLNNMFFIISSNVIGMSVAYALESYLRIAYQNNITLKKALWQVHRMSIFDKLTKVANRRYFDMRFPEEFNRLRRIQYPLSLLIVDIDLFKEYNDHFGHQAGDECLVKIAELLKKHARRAGDLVARSDANKVDAIGDLVTRWGGEEFVIILAGAPIDSAYMIAEKIRKAVTDLGIKHPYSKVAPTVTVSIGVSSLIPSADNSCSALFKAADVAVYRAKDNGRNRVEKEPCA